ncbi:hypothetical protein LCGC14_1454430 [marine sediment metagenome]|uniref:Uncharacterized protein n=1 Tax=marine sediment metagenome TaxID=412755 RepID=A0A0F9MIS9_9ZZZZ
MAKILTKELKDKLMEHVSTLESDFDPQEIKNCTEILEEKEGQSISELDQTILTRIIDEEELVKEIGEITEEEEKGNAFD